VIFLDSWVWLEFLFDGDAAAEAEAAIERAASDAVGGLIAPTVITEVSSRIRSVEDERTAEEAIRAIRDGCEALYSGDPDFDGVDDVETVVL